MSGRSPERGWGSQGAVSLAPLSHPCADPPPPLPGVARTAIWWFSPRTDFSPRFFSMKKIYFLFKIYFFLQYSSGAFLRVPGHRNRPSGRWGILCGRSVHIGKSRRIPGFLLCICTSATESVHMKKSRKLELYNFSMNLPKIPRSDFDERFRNYPSNMFM